MGNAVSTDPSHREARPAWLPWVAALVLAPLLLAALGLLWPGSAIEGDLTDRSISALRTAGFDAATVEFDGRDATITGVPDDRREQAIDAVRGVDGVRVVAVAGFLSVPSPSAVVAALSLHVEDGRLVVSGAVPDEAARGAVLSAVTGKAGARPVVDELVVRPGTVLPGDAATMGALAAALGSGSLLWDGDGVALTGTAPDAAAGAATLAAVRAALPGITVTDRLVVAPPSVAPPVPSVPSVDRVALQNALNALFAGTAISFLPDLPELTPQGVEAVRRAAELLRGAPGARVEIGGHVGVGPGGAENAQRLSDARALTVRDALVAAGIPADSLVTRGYGDSRPKPDLAASRRVEITVL